MNDIVTLWVRTEGVDSMPLLCAPKAIALAAGRALDAAHVTLPESEWTPCCRDPFTTCACVRDQFAAPEDLAVCAVLEAAAERAGIVLPYDEASVSIAAAMAFPTGYIPRALPKKDQVKLAGNAVTPPVMAWIVGRILQALEAAS